MFGSICGTADEVDEGLAFFRRSSKLEEEEEDYDEEEGKTGSEILPKLKIFDDRIKEPLFPYALNMYRSKNFEIKERKYGSHPDARLSLYKPSFSVKKNLRDERKYWIRQRNMKVRNTSMKANKYVGKEIHELFHQAENGPLSIIFACMNVSDVLESLYFVSKVFHKMSVRYFEWWYVPEKENIEKLFGWYEHVSEDIYLGIFRNRRFTEQRIRNGARYKHEVYGNDDIHVSFLTFSIHHNFERLFDYITTNERFKGLVTISEKDYEEAAVQYNDKFLLKLFRMNDKCVNRHVLELSLKAFLYQSNILGIELMEKYPIEGKSKLVYYVYSKFFVEKTFLNYSETNIAILNFVTSDRCEYRFMIHDALRRNEEFFQDYVIHMDEKMIMFLLSNENFKHKTSVKQTELFIHSIMNSQKLKSIEQKRRIMNYIMNELKEEDSIFQFKECRKEGYVFVHYYLENGSSLKEVMDAIDCIELSSPKCFDFQCLVDKRYDNLMEEASDPEKIEDISPPKKEVNPKYGLLVKVLESRKIRIYPEYFYYFIPKLGSSIGLRREDEELIDVLLRYFEVTTERDQEIMQTLLITSLNNCRTKMMRKFLGVKGCEVSSRVVLQSMQNYQTSAVVNYLLEKHLRDLERIDRNIFDIMKVHNEMLRLFKEGCKKYPRDHIKRYESVRQRLLESGHFVPDYACFKLCNYLKEGAIERLWKDYTPKCLQMLLDFFYRGLRNRDLAMLERLFQNTEAWSNSYAMFLFYDCKIGDCEYFRKVLEDSSTEIRDSFFANPSCWKCGVEIFAFFKDRVSGKFSKFGSYSGCDFRRCHNEECCLDTRVLKDRLPQGQEFENIEKVFCGKCCGICKSGFNYCVDCLI